MIFISHSTTNDGFVNKLSEELQIRGIQTWVDHRDMPAGSRWVAQLESALGESDTMLLVLSQAAIASSYVESEWHTFFNMGRKIIPLMLDDCDVPLFLRTFHQVDFRRPERFSEQVMALLNVLPDLESTQASNPFKEHGKSQQAKQESMTLTHQEILRLAQEVLENKSPTLRAGIIQLILPVDEIILQFPLVNEMVLGRTQRNNPFQPDIDLKDYSHSFMISRRHASLYRDGNKLYLKDHNSSNGTYMEDIALCPDEYYLLENYSLIYLSHHFPIVIRYQF